MLVKPIKHGQTAQNSQFYVVGGVNVEILPNGGLKDHILIEIEEANNLGQWPEPMMRVSVNHQKPVFLPLQVVLLAAGIMAPPDAKQSLMGFNITEPEQVKVTPAKAKPGVKYLVFFKNGTKKELILKIKTVYRGEKVLDFGKEYFPAKSIKYLIELDNE